MSFLVYIFPLAALAAIFIMAAGWLPMLRAREGRLPDPADCNAAFAAADAPETEAARRPPMSFAGKTAPITGWDGLLALFITLVYALVAFFGLGDRTAPQSFCHFADWGSYVTIELPVETEIRSIRYYSGLHTGNYYVQYSDDGENFEDVAKMEQNYVALFKWKTAEYDAGVKTSARYIRIVADAELDLGELALYDADGALIDASTLIQKDGSQTLFDEQELVPAASSYKNSTYFDEIYHARTAYEHLENVNPYEISHPPLGKLIIAIGIHYFGMTPFGWRFMGTLFGALMLPVLYVLLKKLFGRTEIAVCGTLIFAFDFMHFVQTRIATIDTYAVFFILLMYLFMWLYVSGGKWYNLALSGLFFGLGAASKWTCIYAGGGLAVIWLLSWVFRRREEGFWKKLLANCGLCLVFFVVVPAVIYYVSYYPYGTAKGLSGGLDMFFSKEYAETVWKNQTYMFSYHSGLVSTHPYASKWYQWIVDGRPILYYLEYFNGSTSKSAIAAFLSPLLCWGGLLAMFGTGWLAIRRRSGKALFILVGYLAQLLPWVLISRLTFEYHYFPSAVFLVLALCLMFDECRKAGLSWKKPLYLFTGASLVLFAAFYPVLSGVPAPVWYCRYFLQWLPSWPV